jgi:hypothetical protein
VLLWKIPLSLAKRPVHWFTVESFKVLQMHRWQKEWIQDTHTRSLVYDQAGDILSCYTSGRIGEYHESSARKDTGRGLLYRVSRELRMSPGLSLNPFPQQDLSFFIIRNAKGEAETIICPTRDAKGMSKSPDER